MDNKNIYDNIIEKIYQFIYFDDIDNDYITLEQLILAEKFCNIILYNFDFKNYCDDPKFKKKVSKESSIERSKEFLNVLSSEYGKKLIQNIDDKVMKFYNFGELFTGYASYIGGVKKIGVPLRNDYSDAFVITHEQIHDTTMHSADLSATWSYFSETPTMLSELLQADYMQKAGFDQREINKYKKFSLSGYVYRALMLKVQINLLKEILISGYIDAHTVRKILGEIYEICHDEDLTYDAFDESIDKLFHEEEIFYFFDLRYVIGGVLSSYLHDKIIENNDLVKSFTEYNETFSNLDIQGVFESIDIEFSEENVLDLSEETYKKLEKSYKNELKRVW